MKVKEKKFISVVVYLHNAKDYITKFFDHVLPVLSDKFEQLEIVCVDDACQDNTMEVLRNYVEEKQIDSMLSVAHMSFFHGLESSMNAGRDLAIGDFVFEFDDVLVDYDEDVLFKVYEKSLEGYDIVAASSQGKMRFTSKVFYSLYNQTNHGTGKIGQETFRILSRRAINRIETMSQYIPYRKALYANCGLKMATVKYLSKDPSIRVKNKIVTGERTSLALDSFIYFTNVLERISAIISIAFLTATVGMGIYIVYDAFQKTKPIEGWLSTMGFMALGFFGVFALLTIILKYLSVMINLVFNKQRYLIADIEKIVK